MRQPDPVALVGRGDRELFTQAWLPAGRPRAAIVILHGFGEHSDRYAETARAFTDAGYAVHALDHQGHGRSQGPRALVRTDDAVADIDALVDRVQTAAPELAIVMLGHSMGGMLATQYAIRHGERLTGLILSGPLAGLDVSPVARWLVSALGRIAPRLPTTALDADLVSRDPAVVTAYRGDPLVHHGRVPAGTVSQFLRTTGGFAAAASAITMPTLVVYGTADRLVSTERIIELGERIGAEDLTVRGFYGLYHEILNEPERAEVREVILAWLAERLPAAPTGRSGSRSGSPRRRSRGRR